MRLLFVTCAMLLLSACERAMPFQQYMAESAHRAHNLSHPVSPAMLAAESAFTEYWLYETGELGALGRLKAAQAGGPDVIYNPKIFVLTNELKVDLMREVRPDVIAIGNSRVNQFRAGMFGGHSFYNMGNVTASPAAVTSLMAALPAEERPKVVIMIIEPFSLRVGETYEPGDPQRWLERDRPRLKMWLQTQEDWKTDGSFDWIYVPGAGETHLGGRAIESRRGTRGSDGAVYWDRFHELTARQQANKLANYEERAQDLMDAKSMFDGFEPGIDPEAYTRMQRFADDMKELGVSVIGLTPPLSGSVQANLDSDPARYRLWVEMQRPEFSARMNRIFPYFNYSRFDSFGGDPLAMMDAIHPAEATNALILAKMAEDPRIQELLPQIAPADLRSRVASAKTPVQNIFD